METAWHATRPKASLNTNNKQLYEIEGHSVPYSLGYNQVFIMVIGQTDFSSRQSDFKSAGMLPCGGNHDRNWSDGAFSPGSHPAARQ